MAGVQLWETLKESIIVYTGLSPTTFFTILALLFAVYYVLSGLFGYSSSDLHPQSRNFQEEEEELPPLRPPVQLGEITEEELKAYDGNDHDKPLLMAIKGQIYDVSQSREFRTLGAMEVEKTARMGENLWKLLLKNLNNDVLVEIFKHFDIFESTSAVGRFVEAWEKANNDQPLWQTLDFSMLKSDFIKTPILKPYVWVSSHSDTALHNFLLLALDFSQGNIKTLIFHYNLYLTNDQFIYTATRCPLVKRLVFVSWNRIKKMGIRKAIRSWKDLESMTMPDIKDPQYVFEEISKHCKNFRELKVMGIFGMKFASSLTRYLPNLKVLSVRCSGLLEDALILILNELKHLEVLNISHSFLLKPIPSRYRVIKDINPIINEKASRLREFFTCMKESCIMCQRTKVDCGLPKWYKYEEGIWKYDEVSSLAL